ncbi:MAG: hypothetical protein EBR82_49585 [Caulobacteraceae bacterium]|nr:hypothetical protein [Caulobacteraceae bacterium]
MKQMVKITNKNILEGEKANPQNCAIARAIKNKMKKKIEEVSVLPTQVIIKMDKKMFVAEMPKKGTNFIKRFDRGHAVNAFELNLNFKKGYALV